MLPSACLSGAPGDGQVFGMYESTAGSAPDIAGHGIANPVGTILSVGMMFTYSFGLPDFETLIERAVTETLHAGITTPDLGGTATGTAMTDAILERLGP